MPDLIALRRRARRARRYLGNLAFAMTGAAVHAMAGRPDLLIPGPSPMDILRVLR